MTPEEARDILWARHQGLVDRKAGNACRKYKEFRIRYGLPESEFTLRLWHVYMPPEARKPRRVRKPEPPSRDIALREERLKQAMRIVNPPEAIRDAWR